MISSAAFTSIHYEDKYNQGICTVTHNSVSFFALSRGPVPTSFPLQNFKPVPQPNEPLHSRCSEQFLEHTLIHSIFNTIFRSSRYMLELEM